jgi:CRP/FNR family cyclic AMP-dependent transcriptional regulator
MDNLQSSLKILKTKGSEKVVKPGVFLWQEGDPSSEVVFVLEGTFEVVKQNLDGREIILRSISSGNLLGEMAALEGKLHSASIRAKTLCKISVIPKDKFCAFVKNNPSVFAALFSQQAERVRSLTQQVNDLGMDPILKRMVKKILEEKIEQKTKTLHLTHQQLADKIGATRESVTKSLGELEHQGWISLSRGKIEIIKEEELRNLSR